MHVCVFVCVSGDEVEWTDPPLNLQTQIGGSVSPFLTILPLLPPLLPTAHDLPLGRQVPGILADLLGVEPHCGPWGSPLLQRKQIS